VVASGSVGQRLAPLWPAALQARLVPPAGDSMDGALRLLRLHLALRPES
jgi:glucosamine kinase